MCLLICMCATCTLCLWGPEEVWVPWNWSEQTMVSHCVDAPRPSAKSTQCCYLLSCLSSSKQIWTEQIGDHRSVLSAVNLSGLCKRKFEGLTCGSAADALVAMEKAMKRDKIIVNDRQLACARIASPEGQDYLKGMAAAGNYAWVNRSSMTFLTRQVK